MATVIDSLIVTLGLDPTNFNKGQKEAAKALITTERQVKSSADGMAKAISGAARQFAIAFLGFESASGLVKLLSNLNEGARQLGLFAQNNNLSATSVRNWSNAVEVAGGSSQGFLASLQAITEQQETMRRTGTSSWTPFLNALGIGLLDPATHRARSQLDVLTDLSAAYEKIAKTQGRATANQTGLSMGIDQGTMNFLLQGPAKIKELVDDQKASVFQVSDSMTKAAGRIASKWAKVKQEGEGFGLALLEKLQPLIEKLLTQFEKWLASVNIEKLATNIEQLTDAVITLTSWVAKLFKFVGGGIGEAVGAATTWLTGRRTNEENRAINTETASNPTLRKLHEVATASGREQEYTYNTSAAIVDSMGLDEAAAIRMLSTLSTITGKSSSQKLTPEDFEKIGKYAENEALLSARAKGKLAPAKIGSTGAARGAGAGARVASNSTSNSSSSTVSIGQLTIQTQATDANGIASDIQRSLQRKGLIAQGDYGLVS